MIINIDVTPDQKKLLNDLVPLIKKIGDTPEKENSNNYIDVINILLEVKKNFIEGNQGIFISRTLPSTHKITLFDADEGLFKTEPLSEIEFIFGENKSLTEDEIRAIELYLKDSVVAESGMKKEPLIIDLGKYDEIIAEEKIIMREERMRQKLLLESNRPTLVIKSKVEKDAEQELLKRIE